MDALAMQQFRNTAANCMLRWSAAALQLGWGRLALLLVDSHAYIGIIVSVNID